ncbi:MAG: PEP-CTERM sorting domain-containing protein [Planctomycetota bacterium]
MKKSMLVCVLCLCVAGTASAATVIDIQNADFEADAAAAAAAGWTNGITDWTGGGCLAPSTNSDGTFSWQNAGGYIQQQSVIDDLGNVIAVEAAQTVDITVDIAPAATNGSTGFRLEIWSYGGGLLGATDDIDITGQAGDEWQTYNLSISWTGAEVNPDGMNIAAYNASGQLWTDNWSATVVPEPATMVLLGLGGLLLRRRK